MQAKVVTNVQSLQSCYWRSEFIWAKGKGSLDLRETESTNERMLSQPPHLSLEGKSPD